MKRIAFDVMGNDNGVAAAIEATQEFLSKNNDYEIILVGDEVEIQKYLKNGERVSVVHSPNVSLKNSNLRQTAKEENSMNTSLDLLKKNKVHAVLSSGESGNYLASASLKLKRFESVSRPAFMPMIPQIKDNKFFLLLDAGANTEVKSEFLVQWAKISTIFYTALFNKKTPTVALLNIGTEDYKGFDYHIEANKVLKETKNMNYVGFIEPRNILDSEIDVVVADGYAGNILLKSMEGTILSFSKLLKQKLTSSLLRKIMALFLKPAFKEVKEKFDYRNVGGAWVIGVNGVVLKAHGSSDAKAYLGAINQIKIALNNDVLLKISKALNN